MKQLVFRVLVPLMVMFAQSAVCQDVVYLPREDRTWGYILRLGYHATDSAFFKDAYEVESLVGPRFSYVTIGLAAGFAWWPVDKQHLMDLATPLLPDNAQNPRVTEMPLAMSFGLGALIDLPVGERISVALSCSVRQMTYPQVGVKYRDPALLLWDSDFDVEEPVKTPFSTTIGRMGAQIVFGERDASSSYVLGIDFQREIGDGRATLFGDELESLNVDSVVVSGGWLF